MHESYVITTQPDAIYDKIKEHNLSNNHDKYLLPLNDKRNNHNANSIYGNDKNNKPSRLPLRWSIAGNKKETSISSNTSRLIYSGLNNLIVNSQVTPVSKELSQCPPISPILGNFFYLIYFSLPDN